MGVYIHYIPCGIIVILVTASCKTKCRIGIFKIPMHREVDLIQSGMHTVIGLMIIISIQKGIVTGWLWCHTQIGIIMCDCGIIVCFPICVAPSYILTFFPCVEWTGQWWCITVPYSSKAGTNLTKHVEIFSTWFLKCRQKALVEGQPRNMFHRIHTETIHSHANIIVIAVNQIVIYDRILCVQVHTVTCDLAKLTGLIIPVQVWIMMINTVCINIIFFHGSNTSIILFFLRNRICIVGCTFFGSTSI